MMTITFQLEKLTCPSCMQKIIDNVNELTEIETIKILFDRSKARVVFEDNKISEEEILHKIEEIGYSAKKI
ncbi:MAG TPA: heavy metal-binding protein [Aerococcaceae bacterium]|uniref:heavy-metal-associated domain-containing protein n=1 Tax=unclassified Ruoffia TaxID=2862149 RepID=UPI000EE904B0|nr:heavy metal-binding protein [Aerococcaceae bacterium]